MCVGCRFSPLVIGSKKVLKVEDVIKEWMMCEVGKERNEKSASQSTPCFFLVSNTQLQETEIHFSCPSSALFASCPSFLPYSTRERDVRTEGHIAAHTGRRLTAHVNKSASDPPPRQAQPPAG